MRYLKILILDEGVFIEKTIISSFKDKIFLKRNDNFNVEDNLDFDVYILVGNDNTFNKISWYYDLLKKKYKKYYNIIVLDSYNVNNFKLLVDKALGYVLDRKEKDFGSKLVKLVEKIIKKLKINCSDTKQNNLIYKSSKIKNIIDGVSKLKQDDNFILFGETGVGKTPLAMYANFCRAEKAEFLKVNCAGMSKEHFYSLLFGHTKGAYTGAYCERTGLIEAAKNGDLFLDEISSLDFEAQGILLNYLDTGEYRRLGEDKVRYSNARIICATNKDLYKMAKDGFFRKDLLTRFIEYIEVPPLRERKEDIEPLFNYFVDMFDENKIINKSVLKYLYDLDWTEANVRELKFFVKNLSIGKNFDFKKIIRQSNSCIQINDYEDLVLRYGIKDVLSKIEKDILVELLKKYNSLSKLAKVAKISAPAMFKKINKYKLK